MGYFPFYKGIKVKTWGDGSRSGKGQQGSNKKKADTLLKQEKPTTSFLASKDINDDYRPIYDKLLDDYFNYYQGNINILSDNTHKRYAQVYGNIMRMQNGINSFIDWQAEEASRGNTISQYLQKGEETGVSGDDSWLQNQLEIENTYANKNDYYRSFLIDGETLDETAYKSVNQYYFGGEKNDHDEYIPFRPDLIENPTLIELDGQLVPDINNPDNWVTNANGQYLKDGKQMRSFMQNINLYTGFEPYYNEETPTKYGIVRNHVSNFKNTANNWYLTPNGEIKVFGYGDNPTSPQDFRKINDYKFKREPGYFLKEVPKKNYFGILGDEFWDLKHGGNELINDEYEAKLMNHIDNMILRFDTAKNKEGTDVSNPTVLGNNIRQTLLDEITNKLPLSKAAKDGLLNGSYIFGENATLLDWLDTNSPGMIDRIMKDNGYNDKKQIKFDDYVKLETFDRVKDNYLISYRGLQNEDEAYFNNDTSTRLLYPGDDGFSALPYHVWDTAALKGVPTGNFIAGTPIHFEDAKSPKINVRLRQNSGIILTGQLGTTVFQTNENEAFKMLFGLDMTMKKSNIVPLLIDADGKSINANDAYDASEAQWKEYVSVEMDIDEVTKQMDVIINTGWDNLTESEKNNYGNDKSRYDANVETLKDIVEYMNKNRENQNTISALMPIEQEGVLTGIFTNDEYARWKKSKGYKDIVNANKSLQ